MDLSGINDYLKSFKEDEKVTGANSGTRSLLPPIESIIRESLLIKLDEERLNKLSMEYERLNAPKKEEKKSKVRQLAKVKQQAIESMQQDRRQ